MYCSKKGATLFINTEVNLTRITHLNTSVDIATTTSKQQTEHNFVK